MAKTRQIIECVPNFSEGRDKAVIHEITSAIEAVEGVKLLDVRVYACLMLTPARLPTAPLSPSWANPRQ